MSLERAAHDEDESDAVQVRCCLLLTSQFSAIAQETAPQEPPKFTINIVRGKDAQNNLKKGRATTEVVIEVRDRNDKPIGGAIVTFTLPQAPAVSFRTAHKPPSSTPDRMARLPHPSRPKAPDSSTSM